MASSNTISILVKAEDQASSTLKKVAGALDDTSKSTGSQSSLVQRLSDNWGTFAAISATAGVAIYGLFGQMQRANQEAIKLQSALMGLNSVARAFGQDADVAKVAAQELAEDGLMSVGEAATGLKNLLASGFSLDQAVTLMKRFKDSAAFGRQSALGFGQAVASATEGIKNGNSILVDNAGVTKNLSIILREAGFAEQDVMRASTDAAVRMALFNGILKETNPQVGDAARYAESAAGKQAMMAAQTQILYQQIGMSLQPAILALLQTLTPIIVGMADWVSKNQELAAAILIGTGVVLSLIAVMGTLAVAIVTTRTVMATFGPTAVASVGMAQSAFVGLRTLLATPIAMPALVVAAAIASLYAVVEAVKAVQQAIRDVNNAAAAQDAANRTNTDAINRIQASNQSAAWKRQKILEISQGGRAMGGPVAQGQSYVVGERGPEIFTPNTSGNINPNASPSQVIVNITGPVSFQNRSDIDYFADRIDKVQRLARAGMAG